MMKSKKTIFLAVIVAMLACVSCVKTPIIERIIDNGEIMQLYSAPYYIYVNAENGNDENNGLTESTALKTVKKAVEKTSELNGNLISNNDAVVIKLSDGLYSFNETMIFNATTFGNKKVVFSGSGNSIISGGETIKGGWTLESADKNIYKRNVGMQSFRQLYVNDNGAIRTRYPNDTGDAAADTLGLKWNETEKLIGFASYVKEDLSADIIGSEIHFVQEWTHSIGIIESQSEKDDKWLFKMDTATTSSVFNKTVPGRAESMRGWLENSYAFLDAENEFYFDKSTGDLYYIPAQNTDINALEFKIPRLETLFSIEGTRDNPIKNVAFENIVFENTNWTKADDGYADLQAGQYLKPSSTTDTIHPVAGIYMCFAQDIVIYNSVIRNMGSTAIDAHIGSKNIKLVANKIYGIAGNGISVGYFNESTDKTENSVISGGYIPAHIADYTEDITITDNYITKIGKSYRGGTAVLGGFVRNIEVSHNEIHDVAYSGLGLGWGWQSKHTLMGGFVITNNKIYDCMNYLAFDGSEMYFMGAHALDGNLSVIRENYVQTKNGLGGLYFDESCNYYFVKDNVIDGVGQKGVINLHDINCAINNIKIQNTYGIANQTNVQTYWAGANDADFITLDERAVYIEDIVVAKARGEWSKAAKDIMERTGIRGTFAFIKSK